MKRTLFIAIMTTAAAVMAGCQTTGPAQRAAAASNAVAEAPQQAFAQQPTEVLFRLAQPEQAQGLSELRLSDGSLWVLPQPVLSRADLTSVEPVQSQQGQAFVRFGFNQEGARKLSELSRRFQGKLLVLTVADNLVAVPRLSEPLTQGAMVVAVSSGEEAMAIARAIAGPGSNTQ